MRLLSGSRSFRTYLLQGRGGTGVPYVSPLPLTKGRGGTGAPYVKQHLCLCLVTYLDPKPHMATPPETPRERDRPFKRPRFRRTNRQGIMDRNRPTTLQLDAPWAAGTRPLTPTPLAYVPNRNYPPHRWPHSAYAPNQLSVVIGFTIAGLRPLDVDLGCDEFLNPLESGETQNI